MLTRRIALTLLVIVPLLAAREARAQDTLRLSLSEAITTAMTNNRQIATSRLGVDNADAQVDEAYSSTLPDITLNGRYTRTIQKQVFYFPGTDGIQRPIQVGADNAFAADITVNQILYNSAAFNAPDAAKSYAKISRQQLRADVAQTVLDVKTAYYSALVALEILRVNEALLRNSEENMKNTQALFKAGLRPEFDALRAEVQVANQRPVVVEARDNYQRAVDGLKLALSLPQDSPVALTDTFVWPDAGTATPGMTEAAGTLEQNNAQVQTLAMMADVDRQLIELKRSDYLPTLALFGTYQLQSQADNFSDLEFQPTSYVGLNLSFNLFNGGETDAQVQQARLAYEQSKLRLAQAKEGMKTQLGIVLRRMEVAKQRVETAARTIEQAERAYKISVTSYKAGTGTQLVINDADLALAQSRLNQLSAVYDYNVASAELEHLLGDRFQLNGSKDVQYNGR